MPVLPRTVSNKSKPVILSRGRMCAALMHWFDTDSREASVGDDGHRIDWMRAIFLPELTREPAERSELQA